MESTAKPFQGLNTDTYTAVFITCAGLALPDTRLYVTVQEDPEGHLINCTGCPRRWHPLSLADALNVAQGHATECTAVGRPNGNVGVTINGDPFMPPA